MVSWVTSLPPGIENFPRSYMDSPACASGKFHLIGDRLRSYIRLLDGTYWVPSHNGFRVTAAPMHSHGLTKSQPMTDIRFSCGPDVRVRPSAVFSATQSWVRSEAPPWLSESDAD